jgi:hypothetical protein
MSQQSSFIQPRGAWFDSSLSLISFAPQSGGSILVLATSLCESTGSIPALATNSVHSCRFLAPLSLGSILAFASLCHFPLDLYFFERAL